MNTEDRNSIQTGAEPVMKIVNKEKSVKTLEVEDQVFHWELQDRMFSEDHMYRFVAKAASGKNLAQTAEVLPLVRQLHEGQFRTGKDQVPYIYHPLMMACHALALGLEEDDILATILLHDVVEDCGKTVGQLPVSDRVKEAVELLSFSIGEGETRAEAKKRYFQNIKSNRLATVVKVIDRCNNISTMSVGFSKRRMARYINETEEYVLPVLDHMKHHYPEFYNASFLLKYQIRAVLESLKRTL